MIGKFYSGRWWVFFVLVIGMGVVGFGLLMIMGGVIGFFGIFGGLMIDVNKGLFVWLNVVFISGFFLGFGFGLISGMLGIVLVICR